MAEWSSNSLSFPFGEPSPSPTTTFPRLNDSLPFQNGHFSSSFSSSLSSPIWGGGAWQAQNCGACEANTRQYRLPGSSHWVAARPSSLSSCLPSWPHLPPPATAHPSWPIHPKGSTKNATNLALGLCSYSECSNLLLLLTNTQSQLKILDIQHN